VRRGDIYLAVLSGDFGKMRPVVIVQSDIGRSLLSRVVCPLTTHHEPATFIRPPVDPSPLNGLVERSYVMLEKIAGIPPHRFRDQIGRLEEETMLIVSRYLALLLDLR
jgi:mRNA interferase MazF